MGKAATPLLPNPKSKVTHNYWRRQLHGGHEMLGLEDGDGQVTRQAFGAKRRKEDSRSSRTTRGRLIDLNGFWKFKTFQNLLGYPGDTPLVSQ